MIYSFRGDTSKGGKLLVDWPEVNPVPVHDASRLPPIELFTSGRSATAGLRPGFMTSVYFGERLEGSFREPMPTKVEVSAPAGRKFPAGGLKDFQWLLTHPLLSTAARELIEALDPGIHQFFEIEIVHAGTTNPAFGADPRYLLNIGGVARADRFFPFAEAATSKAAGRTLPQFEFHKTLSDGSRYVGFDGQSFKFGMAGSEGRWVVASDFEAPSHVFVVPDRLDARADQLTSFGGGWSHVFVSQQFRDAAKKANLTGTNYAGCKFFEELTDSQLGGGVL